MGTKLGQTALLANLARFGHHDEYQHGGLLGDVIASNVSYVLTAVAGADAGDSMPVTISLFESDGATAEATAATILCELHDANGLISLIGDFTMAETGAGAEVSVTAKASQVITVSATTGVATLTITDVATGTNATLYLKCTVFGIDCPPTLTVIDFDS